KRHLRVLLRLALRVSSGEADQAFAWLNRAYSERNPGMGYIKQEPLLKRITNDARYKALVRKMKLPD
ncbi:MAG: hypothetical protein ACYDBZ_15280, partial [Steroidobacteraceae bacterium]